MATGQSDRQRSRAGDDSVDPTLPQKKRARHRLIGALALSVLAAIVVPLVFESEPKRVASDVELRIPPRDQPLADPRAEPAAPMPPLASAPAVPPAAPAVPPAATAPNVLPPTTAPMPPGAGAAPGAPAAGVVPPGVVPPGKPASGASIVPGITIAPDAAAPGAAAKPELRDAGPDPKAKPDPKTEAKPDPKADARARTEASGSDAKRPADERKGKDEITKLVEAAGARGVDKPEPRAEAKAGEAPRGGRFAVQVGAYSSDAGARAVMDRLESAGLRPYTEKIKTSQGERVRVRVGPFPTREAAEQARARLKERGIDAALITP